MLDHTPELKAIVDRKKHSIIESIATLKLTSVKPSRGGKQIVARFTRMEGGKKLVSYYSHCPSYHYRSSNYIKLDLGSSRTDIDNFLFHATGVFSWSQRHLALCIPKGWAPRSFRESDLASLLMPAFNDVKGDLESTVLNLMRECEHSINLMAVSSDFRNFAAAKKRDSIEKQVRYWLSLGLESGIHYSHIKNILDSLIIQDVMKD